MSNYTHKNTYSWFITKEQTKRNNHFHKDDISKILKNLNLEIVEEKLGFRPNYYYFSDDINWVKETFKDSDPEGSKTG